MIAMFTGTRRKIVVIVTAVIAVAVLVSGAYLVYQRVTHSEVTAYFSSTTGLYSGDPVRVMGVNVGTVTGIEPQADAAKVTMSVDSSVKIPEDAKAVIMSPSLVSGRFVQLAPAYTGGPRLADGGSIPVERTAVPVEWDEIKKELSKLSTALGPEEGQGQGPLGEFVNTAEANLDGNGERLRDTLRELSQTMGMLSDGRTDLFTTVRNLQAFVSALSGSNEQIVQFGGRLASVTQVLADSSDELGRALTDLDVALGEVEGFINANTEALTQGVSQLADATKVVADSRPELEQVLHIAPNAMANFYNIYQPAQGSLAGTVGLNEFANPAAFLCGAIEGTGGAAGNTGDLCRQLLAPMFNSIVVNYPPILTNPITGVTALPEQIEFQPSSVANKVAPQTRSQSETPGPRDLESLMLPGGGS